MCYCPLLIYQIFFIIRNAKVSRNNDRLKCRVPSHSMLFAWKLANGTIVTIDGGANISDILAL